MLFIIMERCSCDCYICDILVVIICIAYKLRKGQRANSECYYKPFNAFRIKSLCILLLRNEIDYKDESALNSILKSIDNEVSNKDFGISNMPNWVWSAFIGPIVIYIIKAIWEANSKLFDDIFEYGYAIFVVVVVFLLIVSVIKLLHKDVYGDLRHDIHQIISFKNYYEKFDEEYHAMLKLENSSVDNSEKTNQIIDILKQIDNLNRNDEE